MWRPLAGHSEFWTIYRVVVNDCGIVMNISVSGRRWEKKKKKSAIESVLGFASSFYSKPSTAPGVAQFVISVIFLQASPLLLYPFLA